MGFRFSGSRLFFRLFRLYRVYFRMPAKQAAGVGLMFLVVVILWSSGPGNIFSKDKDAGLSPDTLFVASVDTFFAGLEAKPRMSFANRLEEYIKKRYDTLELFRFNPNTATSDQLKRLGLTAKQIRNIIDYRNSYGFKTKGDFKRLYTMRDFQYEYLEPYIDLPADTIPATVEVRPVMADRSGKEKRRLFAFDPNTVSADSLVLLGFSRKQANSIVKARNNGWVFRKKSDFSRLYVVSDSMYSRLESYILLPDSLPRVRKAPGKTELNTVTVDGLVKLGVTEYAAKEIIKYRQLLGGYYSVNQLYEIYGIRKTVIKKLFWELTVDTTLIKRINLKTADFKTLKSHPYISTYLATWIVARQNKKKFDSPGFILRSGQITRYTYKKLRHYIYVE